MQLIGAGLAVNDTEAFRDGSMGAAVGSLDRWWSARQAA